MLFYTGHPFVDIGAATIAAFAGKTDIADVTETDLDAIAEYMTCIYVTPELRSYLSIFFTINTGFTTPSYSNNLQQRFVYAEKFLRSYRSDTPAIDANCVFTGQKANFRLFRQHVPMLNGEGAINFSPNGDAGLPVSGLASLCIHALPLGCGKWQGRFIAVHSDKPEITWLFAKEFLDYNLQVIDLLQKSGEGSWPENKQTIRTLLIDKLLQASRRRERAIRQNQVFSITAYHVSNSGQSPSLDIYQLPSETIAFLNQMTGPRYHAAWEEIVRRAWEIPPPPPKGKQVSPEPFSPRRNYLYEDLFRLPDNAPRFIRIYFLRLSMRVTKMDKGDPRPSYQTRQDIELVSWKITEAFLKGILHMNEDRIQQIRILGEQLARYVHEENDRKFFRSFFAERNYEVFRNTLLRASSSQVKRGSPPLLTFEAYISVFEESDVMARTDWRLARDLVLIKMIETLYELGRASDVLDALPEETLEMKELQSANS